MSKNPLQAAAPAKGRASLKSKTQKADFAHLTSEVNLLTVDPELAQFLQQEGYAYRWLNLKRYLQDGNSHRSGWVAYQLADETISAIRGGTISFRYGISPEGYIVRNDLVLGVKPIELQEAHRRKLSEKNRRQSAAVQQEHADKLREMVKESGVRARVEVGYDGDDSDDE
jgi:hypothetical protein